MSIGGDAADASAVLGYADEVDADETGEAVAEDGADGVGEGAAAWRTALAPLTVEQRRVFVDTLLAYEAAVGGTD
ncbi:hypothetical protein [Streptomyces sp. NPDC094032]|uniref:hypothetical protein n=1 Tax=Streptomyces sp. NPDC094032 TaxID=3155308 RepID=UPI0033168841